MYVSSIFIDRFGHRARFKLEQLSEGLNVVTGPTGSGKTTLLDFLRAVWGGFEPGLRARYLPPESRGFGGGITIQTKQGPQIISRYDDGGLDGHLTVERSDGAVIGRRHVQDLLGNLSPELLGRAFLVDFQQPTSLAGLLNAARSHGVLRAARRDEAAWSSLERRIGERREQLPRLPEVVESLESLQQRRRELARILESSSPLERPRDATGLETSPSRGSSARFTVRLARLDGQLARARKTLRDVVRRRQLASDREQHYRARLPQGKSETARGHLAGLESQALAAQSLVDQANSSPGGPRAISVENLAENLAPTLAAIRDGVYQLCHDLTALQTHRRYRRASRRQEQLARCESELRLTIRDLLRDRRSVLRRLEASGCSGTTAADSGEWCQCARHTSVAPVAGDFLELERRRTELATLDGQLRGVERRRQLLVELTRLEEERRRLAADGGDGLLDRSSTYLRRISSGTWNGIRLAAGDEVTLIDSLGRPVSYTQADAGTRDQVYLACCLAIATECDRSGVKLPVVLNGAFANYPSKHVRDALELLREFARDRQVICLTRHEHVASIAKLLNVPTHSLSMPTNASGGGRELAKSPHPVSGNWEPRALHAAQYDARAELWDADAFRTVPVPVPVPLRESRTPPAPVPSVPVQPSPNVSRPPLPPVAPPDASGDPSDYFLHEYDSIELAPSLDEVNVGRLRAIGVTRVGDLLRVAAREIARDLRQSGIAEDMVRAWQSQARLMCQIRGLRPYDARILVACGIEEPTQLLRLSGSDLRARVKDFTASPVGQAVLLSGTESELSRVSDWLRANPESPIRELPGGTREAKRAARPEGDEESGWRPDRSNRSPHEERGVPTDRTRNRADRDGRGEQPDRRRERRNRRGNESDVVSLRGGEDGARYYLQRRSPVEDAPTIGPSLARRLEKVGIVTVEDLLRLDAATIAVSLQMARVTPDTVRQWQRQAELVCRVPRLRGHDAQILVATGVADVDTLATQDAATLWQRVQSYADSLDGRRAIRPGSEPTSDEVATWIEWARQARTLQAA